MKRFQLALLLSAAAVAAGLTTGACGGISDPTRGDGEGRVATVSGALTGAAVPANARVALVWRRPGNTSGAAGLEVAGDAPIVGGQFTLNLGVPREGLFDFVEGKSFRPVSSEPPSLPSSSGGSGTSGAPGAPPSPVPAGGSSGGGMPGAGSAPANLSPRETVSGKITDPLSAAIAGFVVYADTNGNGKLDVQGDSASSPDQLLGGNEELILVYLRGGGALDFEKLRDKSGILPSAGYNLAWTEGRWLPLNVVELKLRSNPQLPGGVCPSSFGYSGGSAGFAEEPASTEGKPPIGGSSGTGGSSGAIGGSDAGGGYPSPADPNLQCAPGGRSFTYYTPSNCPPYTPPVPGLCSGDAYNTTAPCARGGYQNSIGPSDPVPVGWPCPVANAVDGGAADAASDAGSPDGG